MRKKQKQLSLHQKIKHHVYTRFHAHAKKILHVASHLHHNFSHGLELLIICFITISSGSFLFANLTGLNQDLYRQGMSEVSDALLHAMQNSSTSLKAGNIISVRDMNLDVENTFAKGYCTYGAARISPEFFPYINDNTQQRTRGGNAVDRCKNASDTGYKIGSTPAQGALIIYDAGGRFGSYGHVGKVLHYDSSLKKIIVRDMARVGRGKMSDRREDLTTANVKCYIYNKTTKTIPIVSEVLLTGTTATTVTPGTTATTTVTTPVVTVTNPTPSIPTIVTPTTTVPTDNHNSATTSTPSTPVVIVDTPTIVQNSIYKNIPLEFNDLSDMAEHFIKQNNLVITVTSKSPLKVGESATLKLELKNKNTGEKYSGLLPFSFTILSTNDLLQPSISNIKLINDGSVDISILSQKIGTASIIVSMDGTKIGEFILSVN